MNEPHNWTLLDQLANDPRFAAGLVVACIVLAIVNVAWDRID